MHILHYVKFSFYIGYPALSMWALARLRPTARPATLATPILNLVQHSVSHVRAAKMKLKQNNLVDLRLGILFQLYFSSILHVRAA